MFCSECEYLIEDKLFTKYKRYKCDMVGFAITHKNTLNHEHCPLCLLKMIKEGQENN